MQDKQVPVPDTMGQSPSLRTQQLINHLEALWKRPYQSSPEMLRRVIEFLAQLPEPYQALGITKIAEYLVSNMSLHFLDILATFQQKAEGEGIDREERVQTLRGIMPELPTISETLPGFSALSWYGILAPAGTPSAVITRLNTELDRIVHEPQIQKRFSDIGGEAIGGPPSTFASLIHDEIARWRQVAKEAGIHIE